VAFIQSVDPYDPVFAREEWSTELSTVITHCRYSSYVASILELLIKLGSCPSMVAKRRLDSLEDDENVHRGLEFEYLSLWDVVSRLMYPIDILVRYPTLIQLSLANCCRFSFVYSRVKQMWHGSAAVIGYIAFARAVDMMMWLPVTM
jgi:hypothetical protein